jgi:hypothetical protein
MPGKPKCEGMDQSMSGGENDLGRRPEGRVKINGRFKFAALLLALTVLAGCSRKPSEQVAKIVLGVETAPHSSPVCGD